MAGNEADLLKGLVCGLMDALMAVCPAGWRELELTVSPGPHGLRVTEIASKGQGAESPAPKPELHLDPQDEVAQLSAGLVVLARHLEQQGRRWSGGKVQVTRAPEFCDWKLLGEGGQVAWFTRLDRATLDALLLTDPLFEALLGTERAFAALQASFEARLGTPRDFEYDAERALLTLQRDGLAPVALPAQLLGTYDAASASWQWSWDDPGVPSAASARVRTVCQPDAAAPGLAALWLGRYHVPEGLAWALCQHVAVCLGARGLFRARLADGAAVAFLAPTQDPPAAR